MMYCSAEITILTNDLSIQVDQRTSTVPHIYSSICLNVLGSIVRDAWLI